LARYTSIPPKSWPRWRKRMRRFGMVMGLSARVADA
jgi:hypothetical protein